MAESETPSRPAFRHRIQVTFSEETGEVTVRHYTECDFGRGRNQKVSTTNRDVALTRGAQKQLKAVLEKILAGNREAMEDQADADAAQLHHLTSAQAGPVKIARLSLTDPTE